MRPLPLSRISAVLLLLVGGAGVVLPEAEHSRAHREDNHHHHVIAPAADSAADIKLEPAGELADHDHFEWRSAPASGTLVLDAALISRSRPVALLAPEVRIRGIVAHGLAPPPAQSPPPPSRSPPIA